MGIEDLELEFEDEAEQSKQNDAVEIGVDLSFGAHDEKSPRHEVKQTPVPKQNTQTGIRIPESQHDKPQRPKSTQNAKVLNHPNLDNNNFEEVQSKKNQTQPHQHMSDEIHELEKKYSYKIAKLEVEKNLMIEYVSNAKLLDFQITQLLMRIHTKNPALKKETQQIKKYLHDFLKSIT